MSWKKKKDEILFLNWETWNSPARNLRVTLLMRSIGISTQKPSPKHTDRTFTVPRTFRAPRKDFPCGKFSPHVILWEYNKSPIKEKKKQWKWCLINYRSWMNTLIFTTKTPLGRERILLEDFFLYWGNFAYREKWRPYGFSYKKEACPWGKGFPVFCDQATYFSPTTFQICWSTKFLPSEIQSPIVIALFILTVWEIIRMKRHLKMYINSILIFFMFVCFPAFKNPTNEPWKIPNLAKNQIFYQNY